MRDGIELHMKVFISIKIHTLIKLLNVELSKISKINTIIKIITLLINLLIRL